MVALSSYRVFCRAAFTEVRRLWAGKKPRRRANSGKRLMVEALDRRLLLMGVTATTAGSSEIDLNITTDSGAVFMTIERSTDGIRFSPLYFGSAESYYADTSLPSATTYYYNVSDTDSYDNPLGSASASSTTLPVAPTFSVATTGGSSVLLSSISWDSAATAMQVYASPNDEYSWSEVYSGGVSGSCAVTGLSPDTQYYFYMTDSAGAGPSVDSSTASATTGPSQGSVGITVTGSSSLLLNSPARVV